MLLIAATGTPRFAKRLVAAPDAGEQGPQVLADRGDRDGPCDRYGSRRGVLLRVARRAVGPRSPPAIMLQPGRGGKGRHDAGAPRPAGGRPGVGPGRGITGVRRSPRCDDCVARIKDVAGSPIRIDVSPDPVLPAAAQRAPGELDAFVTRLLALQARRNGRRPRLPARGVARQTPRGAPSSSYDAWRGRSRVNLGRSGASSPPGAARAGRWHRIGPARGRPWASAGGPPPRPARPAHAPAAAGRWRMRSARSTHGRRGWS